MRAMNLQRRIIITSFIAVIAIALVLSAVVHAAPIKVIGPLVHVAYIDEITNYKTIALQPGQKFTLQFGLPPSNDYSNYMLVIKFEKPSPTLQVICRGECTYVKNGNGLITAVYSENGNVTIVNAGTSTYVGRIVITYMYRKLEEITAASSIVKISLQIPDDTINEVSSQIVKVWVDNNAPYLITDVLLPGGASLEKMMQHGEVPSYIKLEPKRLIIYASKAPKGTYTIVLTYDKSSVMPTTFLVKALEYLNTTIPSNSMKTISSSSFGVPHGWTLLGYIVAVAAIQPVVVNQRVGTVMVLGKLVIPASAESGIINVRSISYLIPSLVKFKYVVGAYIVYGNSFRIMNNMTVPVMVYYIPLVYRPVGKVMTIGNRTIIYVPVTQADVMSGVWTCLVVQLPSYAEIEDIVTPGGLTYSKVSNSLVPWGTSMRPVSISPDRHEAYIVVALNGMREVGLYKIYVKVEPLRIYVTDQYNQPVKNVEVVFMLGPEEKLKMTPVNGEVTLRLAELITRPITAYVEYRGVKMETLILNTIPEKPIHVILKLYNLTIVVTKFRNAPLSGAEVILRMVGTGLVMESKTDANGVARFVDVPAGIYQVTVKIGSNVVARGQIQVNETRTVKLGTNVVLVLKLGGLIVPVTVVQLASVIAAVAVAAVIIVVFRFRKERKESYGVYSEESEESVEEGK
ncbi:MAG: carboxypeptidase regulatory-like domain-containing protein [Crenarchaeota archaeon]|nr:carboxypeptidase regulatory-like domain-containing protein [Thermoproteota archaeon]